mmetsp:Transcript_90975/g.260314  ORF Transcript_90975/g.260314 Transcript_90975/m.260314 type:complete len:217 (-) Transcript_90975:1099-1749(-)
MRSDSRWRSTQKDSSRSARACCSVRASALASVRTEPPPGCFRICRPRTSRHTSSCRSLTSSSSAAAARREAEEGSSTSSPLPPAYARAPASSPSPSSPRTCWQSAPFVLLRRSTSAPRDWAAAANVVHSRSTSARLASRASPLSTRSNSSAAASSNLLRSASAVLRSSVRSSTFLNRFSLCWMMTSRMRPSSSCKSTAPLRSEEISFASFSTFPWS